MRRFFILFVSVLFLAVFSCQKQEQPEPETLDLELNVPKAARTVSVGQTISISTYRGKNPLATDKVVLKSVVNATKRFEYPIAKVESDHFEFVIGDGFESGEYSFWIKRGTLEKSFGTVNWTLKGEFEPDDGVTIYGKVLCGEKPVEKVQVTDGYEVVFTNAKGEYQMCSAKKNSMVYITVPSGYEVDSKQAYGAQANGILPLFWQRTIKAASSPERIDFKLYEAGDQTNHTALFFGDMHLAGGKQNDLTQFGTFTNEISRYLSDHRSDKIYGFTLGDMTWDCYWYERSYSFAQYLNTMQGISGMPIFHAIGNHDHNMKTSVSGSSQGWDAVDWDTAGQFRNNLGPNYYSVNIGKVHYVVIDDIYCKNTTGGTADDRKYTDSVSSDCISWLKKDLANADKSNPVIVTMHAPVISATGGNSLDNATELKNCFSGFSKVYFVSGHSHKLYTAKSSNITEHNNGAVCAAWWWAGYYNKDLNIAQDGAPAGYRIMDVKGSTITSLFKATGRPETEQFRSYDRNSIDFSSWSLRAADMDIISSFKNPSTQNYVYLNVWDYSSDWKISVTEKETGKSLAVSQIEEYDPLYSLAYVFRRYNGKTSEEVNFNTAKTRHMFRVQASSAKSTLEITVTDDEGRTYTETMTRPKEFTVTTYIR